jgi:hypothetical protein
VQVAHRHPLCPKQRDSAQDNCEQSAHFLLQEQSFEPGTNFCAEWCSYWGSERGVYWLEIATAYTNGAWTEAVYQSLTAFKREKGWKIFPPVKCYLGEYHCDFMLFEDGYGCRVACESQWQTFRSNADELKWAFDKLRGVKSDMKLFIFEGPPLGGPRSAEIASALPPFIWISETRDSAP